jgi:hypothetical protein
MQFKGERMATYERDSMIRARGAFRGSLVCAIIISLVAVASHGQTAELTLHPAKAAEPGQGNPLLVDPNKQTDADARPLYEQAIAAMPRGINQTQIRAWLKLPVEQLPQKQVEDVVFKYMDSLRLLAKATRCKTCTWPAWKPGTDPPDMSSYRELAFVIRLWVRLEISRGRYQDALVAMRIGFGMTKQVGTAPTLVQTLVGAAVGAMVCKEIEEFVQQKDSPNLQAALAGLPEPLVDAEKAIESENANLKNYNILTRKAFEKQLKPAHDRVRMIVKRLDNHVNALQVVEAIRHYAATHDGQLPQTLSDVKDVAVPNDLVSGKPFEYNRSATGATLQSAIPEGGNERDAIHYDIVLEKW